MAVHNFTPNDQNAFNFLLLKARFRLLDDDSGAHSCLRSRGAGEVWINGTLHKVAFLGDGDWPRGGARQEQHCLYHPFVKGHSVSAMRQRLEEDGFWVPSKV